MNAGVSTGPCGVVSSPARAAPSRCRTWNSMAMKGLTTEAQGHREEEKDCFKTLFSSSLCPCASVVSYSIPPQLQPVLAQLLLHLVERGDAEVLRLQQLVGGPRDQ